jgi:HEAT repeat protein
MMAETRVPFQSVVEALLDSKDFPRRYLPYFSDIDPASLVLLLEAWPRVEPSRKRTLFNQLEALALTDTLVSFENLARTLLNDVDSEVRTRAIRLLVDCDDQKLVPAYIKILEYDDDSTVRVESARSLGKFVMLGELEEISPSYHHSAEDALFQNERDDDDADVRRAALESLGFSSRLEVPTLIESAFRRADPDWRASALIAMGRSNDDRWQDEVLSMILNDLPSVQLAAVQAAGELALTPAGPILLEILEDEENDEIISAAIWSLSQIGGEDARIFLSNLLDQTDAKDEDLTDFLQDALENLAFTEDLERFELMSFDADELDIADEELDEEDE